MGDITVHEGPETKEGESAVIDIWDIPADCSMVYLWDQKIGCEGAKSLGYALRTHTAVTEIVLYGNKIGDDGAKALAKMLETNNAISMFNIYMNNIGPEGGVAIADAL